MQTSAMTFWSYFKAWLHHKYFGAILIPLILVRKEKNMTFLYFSPIGVRLLVSSTSLKLITMLCILLQKNVMLIVFSAILEYTKKKGACITVENCNHVVLHFDKECLWQNVFLGENFSFWKIFLCRVGTTWCPHGASEPSIAFLNGSDLDSEKGEKKCWGEKR